MSVHVSLSKTPSPTTWYLGEMSYPRVQTKAEARQQKGSWEVMMVAQQMRGRAAVVREGETLEL